MSRDARPRVWTGRTWAVGAAVVVSVVGATTAWVRGEGGHATRLSAGAQEPAPKLPLAARWAMLPDCDVVWSIRAIQTVLGPRESQPPSVADLDGDGQLDVVFGSQLDEHASIYWGSGTTTLGVPTTFHIGRAAGALVPDDLDGDGIRELLVPDNDSFEVRVFAQSMPRRFERRPSISHGGLRAGLLAARRWDGDGVPDLLLTEQAGVVVLPNIAQRRTLHGARQLSVPPSDGIVTERAGKLVVVLAGASGTIALSPDDEGNASEVARWPWTDVHLHPHVRRDGSTAGYLASQGDTLVSLQDDGASCVRMRAVDVRRGDVFADIGGDATPEWLSQRTCGRCESNHLLSTLESRPSPTGQR